MVNSKEPRWSVKLASLRSQLICRVVIQRCIYQRIQRDSKGIGMANADAGKKRLTGFSATAHSEFDIGEEDS